MSKKRIQHVLIALLLSSLAVVAVIAAGGMYLSPGIAGLEGRRPI